MAILPAVPKVVRVDFHLTQATDPNVQVREFFQYAGALSVTDAVTWLTAIVTAWNTFVNTDMSTSIHSVLAQLTDLTSVTSAQVQDAVGVAGGEASTPNAAGVAMIFRKHIARRYRGGHPRIYIPGTIANQLTSPTQWNSVSQAAVLADYVTFLTAATTTPGGTAIGAITHVNISYYQGFTVVTPPGKRAKNVPTPRVTPLIDLITNISSNPTPGSQRRRNEQH